VSITTKRCTFNVHSVKTMLATWQVQPRVPSWSIHPPYFPLSVECLCFCAGLSLQVHFSV